MSDKKKKHIVIEGCVNCDFALILERNPTLAYCKKNPLRNISEYCIDYKTIHPDCPLADLKPCNCGGIRDD